MNSRNLNDTSTHKESRLPDCLFRGENAILAGRLIDLTESLIEYWPVTVRQVYYQAVAALYVENKQSRYAAVSKILTKLRRNDVIPWIAIEDRTRRTIDKQGVSTFSEFFSNHCERFLNPEYFHLCRVSGQPKYIELATEKDALSSIIEGGVRWHCVRLNVVRGQVSATMVNQMAERFEQAYMDGQEPVLIYFGDLDPSGVQIPRALIKNMKIEHGIDVRLVQAGLNPDHIEKYNLPKSMDAAKASDPNIAMWRREFPGVPPTELDALHPEDLKRLAVDTLESELDMGLFSSREKQERVEVERLERIRNRTVAVAYQQYQAEFGA